MGQHVDLVENRWSAGYQERVGRAYEEGGEVKIDTDQDRYRDVVLGYEPDMRANAPERFLGELPRRFHSDYFFATDLHDAEKCPFSDGERIPLEPHRVPDAVGR